MLFRLLTQDGLERMGAARLLDAEEVAQLLSCAPYTVMDFARRGILPRIKVGRLTRFRYRDVQTLVDNPAVMAGRKRIADDQAA